jgi:membrane-associated phospholipid phosphatase
VLGRARPNLSGYAFDFSPGFTGLILRDARGGFGFPSGEAATAGALAASLSRFFPRVAPAFWTLAILAAGARWIPGMHYFSDVVAGVMLGGFIGGRANAGACARTAEPDAPPAQATVEAA